VLSADVTHNTTLEQERTADLMRLVPKGYHSVLDAGARDGYYSLQLTQYFDSVIALDLTKPKVQHERVSCVAGDLTGLPYPDGSFDVVFCTEVLEHIPALEKAVGEIKRVAKHCIVIGVPYKQDIRIGRANCVKCGKISPPWGHVNVFDEHRLEKLFQPFRVTQQALTGLDPEKTNAVATWFSDLGRNPYGMYGAEQRCLHCGSSLDTLPPRAFIHKVSGAIGVRLMKAQSALSKPHANWIHVVFER
jgi:SAM-dependent methyltransferase